MKGFAFQDIFKFVTVMGAVYLKNLKKGVCKEEPLRYVLEDLLHEWLNLIDWFMVILYVNNTATILKQIIQRCILSKDTL